MSCVLPGSGTGTIRATSRTGPLGGVSNLRTLSSSTPVLAISPEPVSIWSWATAALGCEPSEAAVQFTTRQGAARPSCHETCICLLCCLEVVFFDGRLTHCLLDISKQFKMVKMGFLIVACAVQGTPHDAGANDVLKSVGFKLSASASLPALPDGMADKSTLVKVAKKFLRPSLQTSVQRHSNPKCCLSKIPRI